MSLHVTEKTWWTLSSPWCSFLIVLKHRRRSSWQVSHDGSVGEWMYLHCLSSPWPWFKWILVTKSAKLLKNATENRHPKKHLSLSVAICDRKHANRIPRPEVGVSLVVKANVKATTKKLDYYVEVTNREWSFCSNRWVKVGRGQLWSNQSPCARDWNFSKNFSREQANAPIEEKGLCQTMEKL